MRKSGGFIFASGVRSIWLCHQLSCSKDRSRALEEEVARVGLPLTETQVAAPEKDHDDEAAGEIETAYPRYLGSRDTF